MPLNSCFYSSPSSVFLPFFRSQHDILLCEDEYVRQAFPSLSLSVSDSDLLSFLAGCSLYRSVCRCLSQPITSWLQVLNPGPGHQLAHYSPALNLPFSYSLPLSLFSFSRFTPFCTLFPFSSYSFLQISTTQLSLWCLKAVMILIKPDLK